MRLAHCALSGAWAWAALRSRWRHRSTTLTCLARRQLPPKLSCFHPPCWLVLLRARCIIPQAGEHHRFAYPVGPGDGSITLLLLLLEDVFEYQFLYEAMRAVAQEYSVTAAPVVEPTGLAACSAVSTAVAQMFTPPSKRHVALRAYLGLKHDGDDGHPNNILTTALGVLGHREAAMAAAAATLELKFSTEQVNVLFGLKDAVSVINCVAGAGKTELLLAIALQFLLKPTHDGVVFMVAPTRIMVRELYTKLGKLKGIDMTLVARLGVDEEADNDDWEPDFFAQYIAGIAEAKCHYELDILAAIDRAIEVHTPDPRAWMRPNSKNTILGLMAVRHEYLDQVLYSAMHEAASSAFAHPRLFLCTLSFLQKLQGDLSGWSCKLKEHRRLLLIVDEYHQCSMEGLLAAAGPV